MKRNVMLILVKARRQQAVKVQKLLTEYGCSIKTRLGLHDGVLDSCTNSGLIFLELAGNNGDQKKLASKLNALAGVTAKIVALAIK